MSLSRIFTYFVKVEKHNLLRRYSQNRPNLADPAVLNYFKHLIYEYDNLYTKPKKTTDETKRLLDIKPVVTVLEQRVALYDSIETLKELNIKEQDDELKKMIKEEASIYLKHLNEVDSQLIGAITQPVLTEGGVLLEVAAGAGGQEAMLFARELFDMYQSYAKYRDWDTDIASLEESDLGGIRKGTLLINGLGAPELMKVEAGVHRVQRIPSTEKSGRIHTSTVSVAVLPQPSGIEVNILECDIVIETKRASGAGGQHVNTTDSAVRVIHTPTGTAVECQEGRSQIKNKQIALQKLRTLLLEKQLAEQSTQINNERKSQVGSSNRNEKIRTYNYPQDRVTEHRAGIDNNYNLKRFMEGGESLEQLQENILSYQKQQMFMNEINSFVKEATNK